MKSKLIILLALTTFIFWGCKKTKPIEDELPAITNTGANTFGCILDGKVLSVKNQCPRLTIMGNGSPCYGASIYKYRPPFNSFTELNIGIKYDKFMNENDLDLNITAEIDTINFVSIRVDEAYLDFEKNLSLNRFELDFSKPNTFNCAIVGNTYNGNLFGNVYHGTFTLYFKNNIGDTKVLKEGRFDFKL